MSYCTYEYEWISDYHFSNALRYRLEDEVETDASVVAAPQKSLLLWGGVAADSVPFLEPAFVVEAPPALPRTDGPYRLSGRARDGSELFSLSAGMSEAIDGNGSSSFAIVLPVGPDWEDNLASITLDGPGGSVTLDADSDLPAVILRDPLSGRVRGILRDLGGSASTLVDTVRRAFAPNRASRCCSAAVSRTPRRGIGRRGNEEPYAGRANDDRRPAIPGIRPRHRYRCPGIQRRHRARRPRSHDLPRGAEGGPGGGGVRTLRRAGDPPLAHPPRSRHRLGHDRARGARRRGCTSTRSGRST